MEVIINDIKPEEQSLIVVSKNDGNERLHQKLEAFSNHKLLHFEKLSSISPDSASIVCCEIPEDKYTPDSIAQLLKVLNIGGKLVITKVSQPEKIKLALIKNGFMDVKISDGNIRASKPKFAVGSAAQLKLTSKAPASVWKLDDTVDEVETIDPDNLLDEDDLKKPDPTSLRVCGTTGKRKACKDCSCGLAEELSDEAKKVVDSKDTPKSSCGSCYLGDAFRCAACPYLGMPAFKPGEKIQLLGNQLQADV